MWESYGGRGPLAERHLSRMDKGRMNVVVVAEGSSELGSGWHNRTPLQPVPEVELGGLEVLVKRVAWEVYGCDVQVVALPRLRRHQVGQGGDIALAEAIVSSAHLERVLVSSFNALRGCKGHAAVVACDSDIGPKVKNALKTVTSRTDKPVAHLVFDPEFEVLFFDKGAVESAKGLTHCTLGPPPDETALRKLRQAKEPLKEWLNGHCRLTPQFFREVARALPLQGSRPAIERLTEDLGKLFGQKKGRPQATKT